MFFYSSGQISSNDFFIYQIDIKFSEFLVQLSNLSCDLLLIKF